MFFLPFAFPRPVDTFSCMEYRATSERCRRQLIEVKWNYVKVNQSKIVEELTIYFLHEARDRWKWSAGITGAI